MATFTIVTFVFVISARGHANSNPHSTSSGWRRASSGVRPNVEYGATAHRVRSEESITTTRIGNSAVSLDLVDSAFAPPLAAFIVALISLVNVSAFKAI